MKIPIDTYLVYAYREIMKGIFLKAIFKFLKVKTTFMHENSNIPLTMLFSKLC